MIIKELHKSGTGASVIDISLGDKELEVLNALLTITYHNTPLTADTHVFKARVRTLKNQFSAARKKLKDK